MDFMPLPIELVLNVITCLLPSPRSILDKRDPITKDLLSFAKVCHEIRRVANRYLLEYCAFLEERRRIEAFFQYVPQRPGAQKVPSLYLAPFHHDIDDYAGCVMVRDLLVFVSDSLTKLVLDIPLRTCYPEDDHKGLRPILRAGFETLINLEEFVCVQDELFLDVFEHENAQVWRGWPKLRRMALYNVNADTHFWRSVAQHPSLEMLFLTNPDSIGEQDFKAEYFRHTNRALTLSVYTLYGGRTLPQHFKDWDWKKSDPHNKMTILLYIMPNAAYNADFNHILNVIDEDSVSGDNLWNWSDRRSGDIIDSVKQMPLMY